MERFAILKIIKTIVKVLFLNPKLTVNLKLNALSVSNLDLQSF